MENRKKINIFKRISEETGKPENTLRDWEKSNVNNGVFQALKEYVEIKDNKAKLNEIDSIKNELLKELDKLPKNKIKKFYHLIMAEIAEQDN